MKTGTNGGWEFAMLSFPNRHWAHPCGAAGFPTPFSTASGVCGLVAGPSGTSQRAELLSEAFQLAWAGGCATGLPTRSRHACDFSFAS
jgi:hypothetical protein